MLLCNFFVFVLKSSHFSTLFDFFVYVCVLRRITIFAGLTPSSITYVGVFYWPHQKLMKSAFVGPRACLKTKGEFGLLRVRVLYWIYLVAVF